MIREKIFAVVAVFMLVGTILFSSFAAGASYSSSGFGTTSFTGTGTGARYVRYQTRPSFQTYYGSEQMSQYWPILSEAEVCEARSDLMLGVAPAGCQPVVVRSDLLAEQNVPVFCQIDAVKINPLIDVDQIKNIRFTGNYPEEVVGVGFHPARAALRTHDTLLGSPLINNVGYVVVVLKRQPNEKELPDFVNLTLSAQIDYVAGNALGIGKAEFVLEPVSDSEWESEKLKQSFWKGEYFVRLEEVDSENAVVSIYHGDRKITTQRVKKGESSRDIFLPGAYCRAGLQIRYEGFVSAEKKATIEVSSGTGTDVFDVYENSRFLDDRCVVRGIKINTDRETGTVDVNCAGKSFTLELKSRKLNSENIFGKNGTVSVTEIKEGHELSYSQEKEKKIVVKINEKNEILGYLNETGGLVSTGTEVVLFSGGNYNEKLNEKYKSVVKKVYDLLVEYKERKKENSSYSIDALINRNLNNETEKWFRQAIDDYELVVEDFPNERQSTADGAKTYGEMALDGGINLASDLGAEAVRERLMRKYLEVYPNGADSERYNKNLERLYKIDSSLAGEAVEVDGKTRSVRLVSLSKPISEASAEFYIGNDNLLIKKDETKTYEKGETTMNITLERVTAEDANVKVKCKNESNDKWYSSRSYRLAIDKQSIKICGLDVKLFKTDVKKSAKIKLIPKVDGTRTETNFTVGIGIEKRAIELNPDKIKDRIEELNKTIKKWEDINEKLGKVVKGSKGACFATSALLTFKNFFTGLSGESIARQEVMKDWKQKCKDLVSDGKYGSIDACYFGEGDKIDSEVGLRVDAINKVQSEIQAIQAKHQTASGVFGESVDTEAARLELASLARQKYGSLEVDMGKKTWGDGKKKATINEILSEENVRNGLVSTDAIRTLMVNAEMSRNSGLNDEQRKNLNSMSQEIADRVNDNMVIDAQLKQAKAEEGQGYPSVFYANTESQQTRYASVVPISTKIRQETGFSDETITHIARVRVPAGQVGEGDNTVKFEPGIYDLALKGDLKRGIYNVYEVSKKGSKKLLTKEKLSSFNTAYGIGNIKATETISYNNEIVDSSKECTFYETEPYRGMPAIVPFDTRRGWYAATRQTLPVFGGIGAFDASGRVTSFYLCNVGENGRIEFETGYGDDLCEMINLNTGQPLNAFPGLDESEAKQKINEAVRAIDDAARQYGNKFITVNGERCAVGKPAVDAAETTCADFMSPKECYLMFNVCDPVICPSSRCDLGGSYRVADVVQSGIIGSIFLCLPNIREGIIIPVCLTGIHAGIDGLISIMKNHRDCLIENSENGQMVGICDQIYSIYLCEFLWKQVTPFANIILYKLAEMAYGQGVRGGIEYLSVKAAWQNVEKSIDYFTQSYAVNSMEAFRARSIEEVGTEVCKVWISTKSPTAIDSLIEPDSPPQFHAWFDSSKYTDATVPATAQYKVFYHIYAGKDRGVFYSVYLKNPPESGYYAISQTVQVASGFIPRGEYGSETRDFTAPEGYKELCVRINENEECGFKQVSTSFAVNYLRDVWVDEEIKNGNVMTETECISGGNNIGALLTPNVQSGAEEFVSPEIYNRGVIRICASRNPGIGSNPSRYVDVGYCDDTKIRCWLDKTSVSDALTAGNIGMKNETLEELESLAKEGMISEGMLMGDDAITALKFLEDGLRNLDKAEDIKTEAKELLKEADNVFEKLVYSHHKAWLLLTKARISDKVARKLFSGESENRVVKEEVVKKSEIGKAIFIAYPDYEGGIGLIKLEGEGREEVNYYVNKKNKFLYSSDAGQSFDEIGEITDGKVKLDRNYAKEVGLSDEEIERVDGAVIKQIRETETETPKEEEPAEIIFKLSEEYDKYKLIRLEKNGVASDYYVINGLLKFRVEKVDSVQDYAIGEVDSAGKINLGEVYKGNPAEFKTLTGDDFDSVDEAIVKGVVASEASGEEPEIKGQYTLKIEGDKELILFGEEETGIYIEERDGIKDVYVEKRHAAEAEEDLWINGINKEGLFLEIRAEDLLNERINKITDEKVKGYLEGLREINYNDLEIVNCGEGVWDICDKTECNEKGGVWEDTGVSGFSGKCKAKPAEDVKRYGIIYYYFAVEVNGEYQIGTWNNVRVGDKLFLRVEHDCDFVNVDFAQPGGSLENIKFERSEVREVDSSVKSGAYIARAVCCNDGVCDRENKRETRIDV